MSSKPPLAPSNLSNTKTDEIKLSARPDQKLDTGRQGARDDKSTEVKSSARINENEINYY